MHSYEVCSCLLSPMVECMLDLNTVAFGIKMGSLMLCLKASQSSSFGVCAGTCASIVLVYIEKLLCLPAAH